MSSRVTDSVVITGIGICSPLGPDRETTWQSLLAGERGLAWFDQERRWAGGRALPINPSGEVVALAEHVASEAIRDAELSPLSVDPTRLGCVFGTSKGELRQLLAESPPLDWLGSWPSGASQRLAARWNCQGPVLAPVAACATGLTACLRAAELLAADVCDVVLAGSADASLFPAVIGSFQRLGVMARILDDPADAVRPFDRRHSGFLIGEGAACLVMERRSHAESRGVRWHGEWLGGLLGSDPSGITRTDAEGIVLARLLTDLMRRTGVVPDYINLHGTATKWNDRAECRAVRAACGQAADHIHCSGLKGSIGHLLGAAGSVELALTLLALRDQIVPPTINLTAPADGCDLNLTPGIPSRRNLRTAIKVSAGFGGHLAVAAVAKGTKRSPATATE